MMTEERLACRPRVAVIQIGARRHYAVPSALSETGLLDGLYTDLCASSPSVRLAAALIPRPFRPGGLKRLCDRRVPGVPAELIHSFALFGLVRVMNRRGTGRASEAQRWLSANTAFGHLVLKRGFGQADTVYAFNGVAREVFSCARARGMRNILDQTSVPVAIEENLLAEEYTRWPEWETETPNRVSAMFQEREEDEWRLADRIICGSKFLRDCLVNRGVPAARCAVVPYGRRRRAENLRSAGPSDGPLRVLFVGHVRLLKGIQYLMQAAEQLSRPDIQFEVVGQIHVSIKARERLARYLRMRGAVRRSQMDEVYRNADVLVLPSLCEGSANAACEAMEAGLPVVATPNAGTVVRDGADGFIIPPRDYETLAARLAELADDRGRLADMAAGARRTVSEVLGWETYVQNLAAAVGESAPA